jgi:hypothetical protein
MPDHEPVVLTTSDPAALSAADAARYCGLSNARALAELRQQGRGRIRAAIALRQGVVAWTDREGIGR